MSTIEIPQTPKRHFLPEEFKLSVWSKLRPYYKNLEDRVLKTAEDLEIWIRDRNELEAIVGEEFAWRYVRLSQNSLDQEALELYQYAVTELMPKIAPFEHELNKKLVASPLCDDLPADLYAIYLRNIENDVALYREENIPLQTEAQMKAKEHGQITSQMMVEHDGQSITLQQAGTLLEETDRNLREKIYHAIQQRVVTDSDAIEDLFDVLLKLRHQVALNAGFENYRDYKFQAMGRFDYTVEDCYQFHEAIATEIVPVVEEMHAIRQSTMGLDTLRPWDLSVDMHGKAPLKPFGNTDELVEKSMAVLSSLDGYFGESLATLKAMNHLDLDTRPGKHPGGYNMPLHWTGVPFIFMNSANSVSDMRTMLHESGHAVHSMLMQPLPTHARGIPSEVAELASMSMELMTMDYWTAYFDDAEQLRRAKIWQLEEALKILPWIATIDAFQHWLYTHPGHSRTERAAAWKSISQRFQSSKIDRSGLEAFETMGWYRQLHLFEVPFYYIEYGMAQLGAIALWRNFRTDASAAITAYKKALSLGYTAPIGEIYKAAGISFDFSPAYVQQLKSFLQKELADLG